MRKQGTMKMDAAQDRLDTAKAQLVLVEKERREGMARVEAGEAEVRALEAQMQQEQQKTAFVSSEDRKAAFVNRKLEAKDSAGGPDVSFIVFHKDPLTEEEAKNLRRDIKRYDADT